MPRPTLIAGADARRSARSSMDPRARAHHPRLGAGASALLRLAGVCVLLTSPSPVARGDSGPPGDTRALEVILAGPRGEEADLYSIDVSFSEPMVPLGERGRRANDGPLRIAPPLRGHFTWLGTTTVSFLPERPVPPGTQLTCTIPRGTKSLAGRTLAAEFSWTIEVGRPRLLRSLPALPRASRPDAEPGPGGAHPPEEPLLLAFDRAPDPAGMAEIRLEGPDGAVPMGVVPVTSDHLLALFGREADRNRQAAIVVLQPAQALAPEAPYRLVIPAGLLFVGSDLPLGTETTIPFTAVGPPSVTGVEATEQGLLVHFDNPVDPDSVLARVEITPRPRHLEAEHDWGDRKTVRLAGPFRAGETYRVRIAAGLPDFFDGRTSSPFDGTVLMPHAAPELTIFPPTGIVLPDPTPFTRITARNTGPVRIRATWITSAEMPRYFDRGEDGTRQPTGSSAKPSAPMPWESRWVTLPLWDEPTQHPDSIFTWERALARFTPRPAGAHALLIEVEAARRFARVEEWEPDTLHDAALLRVASAGISCTLGQDSGLLWITDLRSGRPVADALVSLWAAPDPIGEALPLWRGRTDEEGLAWTPGRRLLRARGVPILARAETAQGVSWLELERWWGDDEPLVSAATPPAPREADTGHLFTDRAIYRPGETIRWKAYLRTNDASGLHAVRPTPVRARLRLRDREVISTATLSGPGNADGSFEIPPDAPTGNFAIDLGFARSDGRSRNLARANVSIEAFRAPRFEARVEAERNRLLTGSTAVVRGRFAYFAGAPLAGRPVRWVAMRQPLHLQIPGWDRYSFVDQRPGWGYGGDWLGPTPMREGVAVADANGLVRLELPLTLPPEEGDALITVEMEVRDLADQAAADRTGIELLRTAARPAVQADWSDAAGPGEAAWRWAIVDTAGRAVPDVAVQLELLRREWKTVRIRRLGGRFDYENTAVDSLLASIAAVSGPEPITQNFTLERGGLYLMRARLLAEDGTPVSASDLRYIEGEGETSFPRETVQWLDLQFDRETAASGDTVRVVIPTPAGGAEGLLLLESGGLLRAERLSLHSTPSLAVPIGAIAPPDLTLTAILVGPDRVPGDDGGGPRRALPYFARGSGTLRIEDDAWRLKVAVEPSRPVALPGEELEVTVRVLDSAGQPSPGEVTIAVVDEAVLALAAESDPDPLHALFTFRGSGTQYDDTRYLLRLLTEEEKGSSSPGGGGAEAAAAMGRLRSRFDITAYWNPSVPIGPDGTATIRFRLPDALTRYRIRVTAASDQGRFGYGDGRIRVDRPLSVEAALPRFARAGDRWKVGALLQNRTGAPLPVRLSCRLEGGELEGKSGWDGTLSAGETRRVDFDARTVDPGICRVTLSATSDGTDGAPVQDAVRRDVAIEFAVERVTEVAFGRAAPRGEEVLRLDDPGLAGSSRFTARIAPSLLSELDDAVGFLIDYPHTCVEQICSRLLGLLAHQELADRLPADTLSAPALQAGLTAGLAELHARLEPDRFRIWPQGDGGHPYLDAYALLTLARLREAGVPVAEELFSGALGIARGHVERREHERRPAIEEGRTTEEGDAPPSPNRADDLDAFLLWARAEANDPQLRDAEFERFALRLGAMEEAAEFAFLLGLDRHAAHHADRPALRASADARVRRSLESISATVTAAAGTAQLGGRDAGGRYPWSSHPADRVRVQALGLLLMARAAPDHPLLPRLAQGLIEARRHGRWANTHENALALEAMRAYAARLERLQLPLQGRMVLGLNTTEGLRFDEGAMRPRSFTYTLPELAGLRRTDPKRGELPVRFETDGRGTLYYQLRLDRFRPALDAPPAEEGMILLREWIDAKTERPVKTLRRGGSYWVHLALVVPRAIDFLLLEDPLPAGVEAINLRLQTTARFGAGANPPPISGNPTDAAGWDSTGGRQLRVQHHDLLDQAARFYADDVSAGVYHLYYPVAATTPGVFGVPGARAELLYEPEVYAVSGAERVVVE